MFRKSFFILIAAALALTALFVTAPSAAQSPSLPSQPFFSPRPATPRDAATLLAKHPVAKAAWAHPQTSTLPNAPIPAFETQPDSPITRLPDYSTTRLPIIEYHYSTFRMGDGVRMETEWFESQLGWLDEAGFTTLTAEQLVAFIHGDFHPPQRSVVLAFDVGASKFDDYTNVVIPALRKHNFHGIFFILASRTLDSCADPTLTCWPMIKQWADEGIISFGSHSWSHIDYATLTPEQIYLDAARSKALIEEKTGHPVLGLCYPFDSVTPAAFDLLDALGYQFAVGGPTRPERSAVFNDPEPYNLPRYYPYSGDYYPLIGGTGGLTFEEMITGAIDQ